MMRTATLAVALVAAACGYRSERDRSLAPDADGTIPKVALMPFDTTSYRRGLEITLTQLVDDELRSRTGRAPYAPDEAEILLGGTITRADARDMAPGGSRSTLPRGASRRETMKSDPSGEKVAWTTASSSSANRT